MIRCVAGLGESTTLFPREILLVHDKHKESAHIMTIGGIQTLCCIQIMVTLNIDNMIA